MPYRIEKIVVEGFRGFRKRKELEFGEGLVIICGPQRSGKSSVLNAAIWTLIGSDAAKVNLGPVQIRERASWLAENLEASDCRVGMVLREASGGALSIERQKGRDRYAVRLDGRESSTSPLDALSLTLDGLVSSVFLPQEVVRAALSVEPRHRRAIFTQLAGLEDLRALEECFKNASGTLKTSTDQIVRRREAVDTAIKAQVAAQKERIRELSEKVHKLGLSAEDISSGGIEVLANQSAAALTDFCRKYRMEIPALPEIGGADDLPAFVEEVRSALSRFEAKSPETDKQSDLYGRKHKVIGLAAEQEEIKTERKRIDDERQAIAQAHGTEEELRLALEEARKTLEGVNEEISQAGRYQTMIQEALTYFETLPEATREIQCPVCRTAGVRLGHVREHLATEIGRAGLGPLRERKSEIERKVKDKERARDRLQNLAEDKEQVENKLKELMGKVSELRDRPLGPQESVERVLSGMAEQTEGELKELQGLLEARGKAIQNIRTELDKLGVAGDFHRERQRLAKLDDVPNLPEYRALAEVEERVELQMGLLRELESGMKEEVEQAFREKFAALKQEVNQFYRRLVGREDFPEIWIDAENWEVLAGAGGNGTAVTRVFNVGDMTAVALSLFLASASRASHDASFILLDDPTQNLDEEHETRLAEIVAELAEDRQVVVASSRTSFLNALESVGTVTRQIIRLAPWDSERSCQLQGEAPEG